MKEVLGTCVHYLLHDGEHLDKHSQALLSWSPLWISPCREEVQDAPPPAGRKEPLPKGTKPAG